VHDNWALLYAQELAEEQGVELVVAFCLVPYFLEATIRQYGFMLAGLKEIEEELAKHNIAFHLLLGDPIENIPIFADKHKAGTVVTDFDPLRIKRKWKEAVAHSCHCAMHEVDTHNIIPCRVASAKQEFGAYTLRPKIHKVLEEYLTPFPLLKHQNHPISRSKKIDWPAVRKSLRVDMDVPEVQWCIPGERAAKRVLKKFIDERLVRYEQDRNDPMKDAQSHLSPYLHFGHISSQRVALEIKKVKSDQASVDAFLEELIVRKELSDNFCYYNENYDSSDGFPAWAKKTLAAHAEDSREYTYTRQALEKARTHDPLWNAAQVEMIKTGKMHSYMRMYWAKKILEWTKNPDEAMQYAIFLNDKYELDGRDPNGYVGVAWSIGGVHDRAWSDRPVFGKIRYMSYNGCKSKFDTAAYVKKWSSSFS
jgi:deoxyribodipyrimidine photo-lyase